MSGVVGKCLHFPRNQHGFRPTRVNVQILMLAFSLLHKTYTDLEDWERISVILSKSRFPCLGI